LRWRKVVIGDLLFGAWDLMKHGFSRVRRMVDGFFALVFALIAFFTAERAEIFAEGARALVDVA